MAVAPIARPNANAYINANTDSVRPTIATASAPSLATKKISTIAKVLSINISRIIGTASKKIASPIGPLVKSRFEPRTASRSIDQNELSNASEDGALPLIDIKLLPKNKREHTDGAGNAVPRSGAFRIRRCLCG